VSDKYGACTIYFEPWFRFYLFLLFFCKIISLALHFFSNLIIFYKMSSQDDDDQCKKCGEKCMSKYDAIYKWCKSCQINNLKQNFTNWTSENEKVDNLIQEMQLEINELDDMIFEWIPYNQFDDIKEIGEGTNKAYLAIWKDGPLDYDKNKYEYTRKQQNKKVVLKLYNLRNIINEFFIDQVTRKFL
jgi:hypothetical protein